MFKDYFMQKSVKLQESSTFTFSKILRLSGMKYFERISCNLQGLKS